MIYSAYIGICNYANMQKGQTELGQNLNMKITCSIVGARGLKDTMARLKFCFATSVFRLTDHINSADAEKAYSLKSKILENLENVFNCSYDLPLKTGIVGWEALI